MGMLKTVMVVDDNETDLLFTRLTLERAAIASRLVLVTSVDEALARLADADQAVDLILLDVNMPGQDGFDFLARHGRPGQSQAPVVMLSASPDPADRTRALAHACVQGFLSKPLSLAQASGLPMLLQP